MTIGKADNISYNEFIRNLYKLAYQLLLRMPQQAEK